jgi:hypothetical protein
MKRKIRLISIGLICLMFVSSTSATIRIVAYNCVNRPNNTTQDNHFRAVFEAIGNESVNGIAKRLDLLVVSETDTGSRLRLPQILNDLYGVTTYDVNTSSTSQAVGGDRTGVVFDTSTLTLLDTIDLTNIGLRPILRAHFRPVGQTDPNSDFYVYAVHLKASDTPSDRATRAAEVTRLRANADALGEGAHIIFAGDFNLYRSSEDAWRNMLDAGNAQAFDPLDSPGDWHDDAAFISLHSQRPDTVMDDRFDFQFVTGEFLDGSGLDYVSGSYHVFGNNGTHTFGDRISTGTGASQAVLTALENASDHLPVVADYEVGGNNLKQLILQRITQIEQELDQLRALVQQLP